MAGQETAALAPGWQWGSGEMSVPSTAPLLLPLNHTGGPAMQANPICSGATQTPAPSSRQCCSPPCPGVTGSAKGTCWCPVPALDSSPAPDLQIPVLPWAPLPSCAWPSFLTLSQNSPLCSRPEPRTAQPQNKPTSDHPSNREVACWSTGTGGVAEQSLGECSHIPQLSTGSPWGWTCSSQGWGLHYRQDPPTTMPQVRSHGDPPSPFTWVLVQWVVRGAASALWQRRREQPLLSRV